MSTQIPYTEEEWAKIQVGKVDNKPVTRKRHPWQRVLFLFL